MTVQRITHLTQRTERSGVNITGDAGELVAVFADKHALALFHTALANQGNVWLFDDDAGEWLIGGPDKEEARKAALVDVAALKDDKVRRVVRALSVSEKARLFDLVRDVV